MSHAISARRLYPGHAGPAGAPWDKALAEERPRIETLQSRLSSFFATRHCDCRDCRPDAGSRSAPAAGMTPT